ncbi:MAG TPA: SDR family oxidoreductase [Gaiellaceae bacterium]|jgi:NAD(P)-dependent dehydrogenase (short-subunit alcohol dehydrogenase family)
MSYPGFGLDGKVAVVTGASSGIGTAVAEAMSEAGAKVVLTGRDEARLRACAERCSGSRVVVADLLEDDAPAWIVAETIDAFGALNVIVHSAGLFWPRPFAETPLEELDLQWRVNVRAPYALTQAALPHLGSDGVVIFVSSIAGQVAFPNSGAYCATKGAIEQLTKALSVELAATGLRVNAIAPGNIHTPMNERFFEAAEYERSMIERTPFGRVGVVEDIASVAVFLASDAARYIHGESILVDGGWAAQ